MELKQAVQHVHRFTCLSLALTTVTDDSWGNVRERGMPQPRQAAHNSKRPRPLSELHYRKLNDLPLTPHKFRCQREKRSAFQMLWINPAAP